MKFKNIFLSAFEKAKKDTPAYAITQLAQHIADVIDRDFGYKVTERTLRDYHNAYRLLEDDPVKQPKPPLIEALCKYLGYDSYDDYIKKKPKDESLKPDQSKSEDEGGTIKKRIVLIIIGIVVAIVGVGFSLERSINSEVENNCMIWTEDHYEIVVCSGKKFEKKLDKETEKGMKQLFGLCKDDTFFLPNDEPLVWYDKYHKNLTFFTMEGIHPTNGRTLKKITQHIIDTHIKECVK